MRVGLEQLRIMTSSSKSIAMLAFRCQRSAVTAQRLVASVGRRRCGADRLNGRVGGRPTARYFVLTRRCRRLKPARSACGANDVIGEFLAESVLDTLNRRSPTSCWQRRSPRGPAADWHRRCPSSRAGWRCSKRSPVAGCSRIGSTTTPAGFVSPAVRRIPTPSTCTRRSRAESATAPHGGGMVRRTWLPQRGRQPCARGRRPETCRRPGRARRDTSARGVKNDDVPRDCQETAPAAAGIQGTTSAGDRLGKNSAAAQGARRCRAESL